MFLFFASIPHAASLPVHQSLSVSPTNSMANASPAKESPLAEQPQVESEGAEPIETESDPTAVDMKHESTTNDVESA